MTNFSAEILEALGNTEAAANLRWRETPRAELAKTAETFEAELDHAEQMLAQLEASLCKRCAREWKAIQP